MSKMSPLEKLMRRQYEQGLNKGYDKGYREGRETLRKDGYRTALAQASDAHRQQNNSSAFERGVAWEKGCKVESMQIPITRGGKDIFITVVKKAAAK